MKVTYIYQDDKTTCEVPALPRINDRIVLGSFRNGYEGFVQAITFKHDNSNTLTDIYVTLGVSPKT